MMKQLSALNLQHQTPQLPPQSPPLSPLSQPLPQQSPPFPPQQSFSSPYPCFNNTSHTTVPLKNIFPNPNPSLYHLTHLLVLQQNLFSPHQPFQFLQPQSTTHNPLTSPFTPNPHSQYTTKKQPMFCAWEISPPHPYHPSNLIAIEPNLLPQSHLSII
ncbi:hypothetical protein AAZV13_14G023700 [Glycine max]